MRKAITLGLSISVLALVAWGSAPVDAVDISGPHLATFNGDVNADEVVDISDAIYLLDYLYGGGMAPIPLFCEPFVAAHNGDVNGSGEIDISDPIHLLSFLYIGGRAPVEACPLP